MFLLDTNVISELRAGKPAKSPAVRRWAAQQPVDTPYLSAITILELGVQALEYRTPPQGSALRGWLDGIRKAFDGRIIAFDEAAAVTCATLHIPDRRSDRDAMIAAIALKHRLAVVTRNTADFEKTGVALLNPWLI